MNPDAVSPVGARGLAQIMPQTWIEVTRRLGWGAAISPFLAEPAIEAGAYYQAQQRRMWGDKGRTAGDRNQLGQASYNAGAGSILKAQKLCGEPRLWAEIAPCLTLVTGRYSAETLTYVGNIARWQAQKEARSP